MSLESGVKPNRDLINISELCKEIKKIVQLLLGILRDRKNIGGEIFSSIGDEQRKDFDRLMELSEKGIIYPGILDNIEGTTKYGEYNISYASIIQALFY